MQTATNPQTGEVAVLVNDQWVKADRVASNDKGEKAYLVGGKWLTSTGTADLPTEPKRTLAGDIGRQLGLTVRAGVEGATALPNMVGDALGLRSTEAVRNALTSAGLPVPSGGVERVSQDVAQALAGTGAIGKVAQVASPSGLVGQAVARLLSENMGTQAASAAAASGAAGTTREMGGGPGSQILAGLAGGLGAPLAVQAITSAPSNMVARSVLKSDQKEFAKEGERLARDTGIDLTLGQRTGNKMVLGMENAARQYGPTADRVEAVDVKIANQAIDRVRAIADRISKTSSDTDVLGTKIEDTIKGAATRLDAVRNKLADRDYGRVRALAGDAPVVKFENFTNELRRIIDQYDGVAGADARKIVAQARSALSAITESGSSGVRTIETPTGKTIKLYGDAVPASAESTIQDAMKTRSFYGKAARGAANVFEDIAPNENRTIAARLFGAINRDFDQSASNASGELRKALDSANGNFKKFSQSIEYLEKSALGKMVGDELADAAVSGAKISSTSGEAIVKKLLSADPSVRRTSMQIIERFNPELAKETRSYVLRNALDEGMSIPPSAKGASEVPVSFAKFVKALQGDKVSFEKQLQSYGFKPDEIKDIKDTVSAMVRSGDKTGFNYSGTQVQGQSMEIAGAVGAGAMGNIKGAAAKMLSIGGKYIGLNKFAKAMESAEGRAAIRTIVSPKASPQAAIAAFQTLEDQ